MIKIRDILPLIYTNDIRLLDAEGDEICLMYQGYNTGLLSENLLNRTVKGIWNDECITNTVNIQIGGETQCLVLPQ